MPCGLKIYKEPPEYELRSIKRHAAADEHLHSQSHELPLLPGIYTFWAGAGQERWQCSLAAAPERAEPDSCEGAGGSGKALAYACSYAQDARHTGNSRRARTAGLAFLPKSASFSKPGVITVFCPRSFSLPKQNPFCGSHARFKDSGLKTGSLGASSQEAAYQNWLQNPSALYSELIQRKCCKQVCTTWCPLYYVTAKDGECS